MRRLLIVGLTGVLVSSCAGTEVTGPPLDPVSVPEALALSKEPAPPDVSAAPAWEGALDDAIERLAPALGPAGAALGAPLRQLRNAAGGLPDAHLLAAARRQFDALADRLPPDLIPDADAFRITLDALAALGAQ